MEAPIHSRESRSGPLASDAEILVCPLCGGGLDVGGDAISCCFSCGRKFRSEEGIPQLFWLNDWPPDKPDVTEVIKSFYEQTPFPNYDEFDSSSSLKEKASRGVFARLLDE